MVSKCRLQYSPRADGRGQEHDLDVGARAIAAAQVSALNGDRECPLPITDPLTPCVQDISATWLACHGSPVTECACPDTSPAIPASPRIPMRTKKFLITAGVSPRG